MKLAIFAALVLLAAPAAATERTYSVTSFDRIRIDGPYQVSLKTNVAPFATPSRLRTLMKRLGMLLPPAYRLS